MPKGKTKKVEAGRARKEMIVVQEKPSEMEEAEEMGIYGGVQCQGGLQTIREENVASSLESDVEWIRKRIQDAKNRRLERSEEE